MIKKNGDLTIPKKGRALKIFSGMSPNQKHIVNKLRRTDKGTVVALNESMSLGEVAVLIAISEALNEE